MFVPINCAGRRAVLKSAWKGVLASWFAEELNAVEDGLRQILELD